MLTTLTSLLSAYASTGPFFGSVSDCGGANGLFTIDSLALYPDAPISGQNVTLFMNYSVPDNLTITGGTAEYDVTWNYIPFEPTTEPLCQNVPCPLGPGHYTNQSTSQWPSGVSGYISSQMKWWNTENRLLLCVEILSQSVNQNTALLVAPPAAPLPSMRPLRIRDWIPTPTIGRIAEALQVAPSLAVAKDHVRGHLRRLQALFE